MIVPWLVLDVSAVLGAKALYNWAFTHHLTTPNTPPVISTPNFFVFGRAERVLSPLFIGPTNQVLTAATDKVTAKALPPLEVISLKYNHRS